MKDVYKDRYGKDIHEDTVNRLYSIAVSIFAIGGMLGGFSGGMIANRFGRYFILFTYSACAVLRFAISWQHYIGVNSLRRCHFLTLKYRGERL